MIELYGSTTPNVQKVILTLMELGLDYEMRLVNVWRGEQFDPAFVDLNPNSKVPVLVDHDGPGGRHAVIESGAILLYLAEKTGSLLPKRADRRSEALQWLMWQMASLGPMSGQVNHFRRFAPPGNDYARSRYVTEAHRLYGVLDRRLAAVPFLGGEDYSIADIAAHPWIRSNDKGWGEELAFARAGSADHPNLWRWFTTITARPAAIRAYERIATLPSNVATASPDDLDRIFGRGPYARA